MELASCTKTRSHVRRLRAGKGWRLGCLVAGAAIALASGSAAAEARAEPIAEILERDGYACHRLEQAELRDVDRSGALYRVRCDGNTRYAMLIRPDSSATIVAEGEARRVRRP